MVDRKLNILVVRTDRIGDVVLTTPAVRAIRQNFPDAQLTMLVAPLTRDLVDGNPDLDAVMVDDRGGIHRSAAGFCKLALELRARKFDWVFVFHTKRRTNLLCFLAGIPRRTGYKNEKYGFLLTDQIADDRESGHKHESQYCLDVLKAVGLAVGEARPFIPVKDQHLQWVKDQFANRSVNPKDVVVVNPCASDPAKQWPVERFRKLITMLRAQYPLRVAVIGAKNNPACEKLIELSQGDLIDLTGQTTVGQLAAVLSLSRMLISNDSGPVHVAAALDTPVVSIFTRNEPGINFERWRPLGEKTRIVVTPYKGNISFRKAQVGDASYLDAISVESVWEAVDALLKLC